MPARANAHPSAGRNPAAPLRASLPGEASQATPADGLARMVPDDPVSRLAEKVRSATLAGRVSFLPYLDPYTEETFAMRRMYPIMLRNPVVKQSLQHKIHSVAALDLVCEPTAETERDHEVSDFVRYAYTEAIEGGFPGLVSEILSPALIYKASISEKVWCQDLWPRGRYKGKRFYHAFKAKEYVEPLYDEFRNLIGVRAIGYGQADVFPPSDFIQLKNWPLFGGPGMSDFRAAYKYLWELDTVEKLHGMHLERYVTPVTTATYEDRFNPAATTDGITNRAALEADLMGLRSRSWIVVPDSVKLDCLQLAVRGEAEFLEYCRDRREQITLSITGAYLQMLTAASGGDIRGNTRTHQSTSELLVWELAARLAAALNSQATPMLVEENYAGADYPSVSLGGISYDDLSKAIVIDKAGQAMGAPLSLRGMARKYGWQLAADEKDVMRPIPTMAPAGAVGQGGGSADADYLDNGNGDGGDGAGE